MNMKSGIISFIVFIAIELKSVAPDGIRIGLITDRNVEQMQTVFQTAIEAANADLEVPLWPTQSEVTVGDSYEAYKAICEMLMQGVGGIFGTSSKNTAMHLMAVCDAKEIPFMSSHMDFDPRKSVMVNLHPHPKDIAKVIHDLIDAFEWKSLTFLYESGDYLTILNELISLYDCGGPFITVRRYDLQLNGNYKSILRRVRKSDDSYVVIVGSVETLPEVLRQAQQVGIITEDYSYIIGSLDLQAIDLEEFKYSEVNITSIRMFSPEQPEVKKLITALGYPEDDEERNITCPITIEMALLYDAIQLYAETTKTMRFKPVSLNCSDNIDWERGSSFGNFLHSTVAQGLTGNIFLEAGIRKDYNIELVELTAAGLQKIGDWHSEKGLNINRYVPSEPMPLDYDRLSLVNKSLTVLLAMNAPHVMLKQSTMKLSGNNRYEGFGVELIQRLAEKLGFNYTFNMHVDGNYGSFNSSSNISTGMVREIMEGRADLGVTDLTITSEREAGVDFTIPFMNLGISVLYQKPRKLEPKLFSFMDPFSGKVWIWLGISFFGVSLAFFILGRLAPGEWDNPYSCIEEPEVLENQLTISNSIWFATGALLQQGSEIAPKALSTRLLSSIWWFFTLILVASYTANLAACLTIENPTSLINDVKDLAENKGGVTYGAKSSGSTRTFFKNTEDVTYSLMNDFMNQNPNLLTSTNDEGVQRVLTENYAFLMESTSIEYNAARICNLTQIGGLLDEKGYGIAMKKNWPYRDKLNDALLELQESGVLAKMKSKWWFELGTGSCTSKTEQSEAKEMGMPNLGGVYLVLLIGTSVAAACGLLDWLLFVFRKARHYKVRFWDAFREEFLIVIDFSNNTKIVCSTGSIYSKNSSLTVDSRDKTES
ncbi:glutamate receptor ionotropic, kainate 2-like [Episyrphus balteatus]|uniref:glutamate receptor ionotropic, kainate 2-like n=1 Tax=Episyrphus balteatus TaxID=286459 RepID=UPI00248545CF|nr:glutamate receptor ionotropic, kainate 2-like [Episyrphus balteatus]